MISLDSVALSLSLSLTYVFWPISVLLASATVLFHPTMMKFIIGFLWWRNTSNFLSDIQAGNSFLLHSTMTSFFATLNNTTSRIEQGQCSLVLYPQCHLGLLIWFINSHEIWYDITLLIFFFLILFLRQIQVRDFITKIVCMISFVFLFKISFI